MYKNEFDNCLKQGKRFKAYMFYGQSIFLIEQYSLAIAQSLGQSDEVEKLYFDDYDFKYAKDKLLQSSLFSSNNSENSFLLFSGGILSVLLIPSGLRNLSNAFE